MRELDHVGIPTKVKQSSENYMEGAKLFVTDYMNSEHKIEWLRFESDSDFPELIQTTAHLAYRVDNMEDELKGAKILLEPFAANDNLIVAFIEEEGAPIELMKFKN